MKNTLKNKIEYCGLNYKTEISKLIVINVIFSLINAVIYYLQRDVQYAIFIGLFQLLADYLFLSNYSTKIRILEEKREDEFVTIISYFEIFITNKNNVYQSFNKVIQYSSTWMKDVISKLLQDIDKDKTVQPFIDFANNFKMKIATNIMLSIYTMVEQGESFEQINNFQLVFEELLKTKKLDNLDKKKRSLSVLASLPLAGAGLITIVLTIGIISIIGDLINVI